jgi:hypothetical protein
MRDSLQDYLSRRKSYRRARDRASLNRMVGPGSTDRPSSHDSTKNMYDSTSSSMESDYARGRRGRRHGRSRDNSYGVGHYIYEQPYTPYLDHAKSKEDLKEYEEDLKDWILDLKEKDHFKMSEHEVIEKAKEMGVKFHEFSELEYYAVYLMMVSDYPHTAHDPHIALIMAKEFLMDDDLEISPSEKVCKYLYEIVLDV